MGVKELNVRKVILMLLCIIGMTILSNPTQSDAAKKGVEISKQNFPDKHFRKMMEKYDKNKNKYLDKKELKKITKINLRNSKVKDITGIDKLVYVEMLDIRHSNHKIKTKKLDLRKLKKLEVILVREGLVCSTINLSNCKKLNNVDIMKSSIGEVILKNNVNLELVFFKDVKKLKKLDFSGSKYVDSMYINCTSLENITLPKKLQHGEFIRTKCKVIDLSKLEYVKEVYIKENKELEQIIFPTEDILNQCWTLSFKGNGTLEDFYYSD